MEKHNFQWPAKNTTDVTVWFPVVFPSTAISITGIFKSPVYETIYCDYLADNACYIKGYYPSPNISHLAYLIAVGY